MKTSRKWVRVTKVEYRNTSFYGNPSQWVTFMVGNSSYIGYTAVNAACGYSAEGFKNKLCDMTYHVTRRGNIIIDFMRNA